MTHKLRNVSTQDQATKDKIKYKTAFGLLLKYLAPNKADMGTENIADVISSPVKPYFSLYLINFLRPGVTTAFFFLLEKNVDFDFKYDHQENIFFPV